MRFHNGKLYWTGTLGERGRGPRQFNEPRWVALDSQGRIYVSDTGNQIIRRIKLDGTVTTVAGKAGSWGSTDGTGASARFSAPMGMFKRNPDGTYTTEFEPILLMLSTPSGVYVDGSHRIQGQESGGLPSGFTFGHDMSSGDVNGDGNPDFFTGKSLFLGDGTGGFTNATSTLPQDIRPNSTYLMTSLIGDFDGDGIGDIVSAYADHPEHSVWCRQLSAAETASGSSGRSPTSSSRESPRAHPASPAAPAPRRSPGGAAVRDHREAGRRSP
jgi:hypothetical protein